MRRELAFTAIIITGLSAAATVLTAAPATGPLVVCKQNPRYFADRTGKAIYLTGAHTWNNLQDMGPSDPPARFDFDGYLDFLEKHHHNFIRLWRWELVSWDTAANNEKEARNHFASPHPWPRTGTGKALDGKAKFDLNSWDDTYFERLRGRVVAAGKRGIYVSVMLFEGWGMQFVANGWKAHPFHPDNNSNGVDGDANHDGKGLEIHTLAKTDITKLQEAYVRKVVDTVNDFDNVLYEISNENHPPSTEWQCYFIRFIHDYEKSKPKQHPVGMTFQYQGGKNAALFESPADWVSPNPDADGGYNYRDNPPPADGRKVVLSDTDHLWGIGGDVAWAWKSFARGLNPLFMDPYKQEILSRGAEDKWEPVRKALGDTRRFSERMNLAAMKPAGDLSSTSFCLADPGAEYLIYQPRGGEAFTVELKPGKYTFEWFDPGTNAPQLGQVEAAGGPQRFAPLSKGDAVLYLKAAKAGSGSVR